MSGILQLDPKVLASIHDFDWAIKSLALGEYHGLKRSGKLGTGMEFSQYRPYSQGDDLRQLDWKMYARSDKFYIKQSEVETNVDVTFLIDTSKSMIYKEQGWSKLDFAKMLAGVLGYVALENGDWIGVADETTMKSGNDSRHWIRFLNTLQHLKMAEDFSEPFIENRRSKELFVVISDLYDVDDQLLKFIKNLKSPRNEVIVFHLMGEKEQQLDFGAAVKMEDLETGQTVQLNAEAYRSTYFAQLVEWKSNLSHEFLIHGIDYQFTNFTSPMADVVNVFLRHRKQLL